LTQRKSRTVITRTIIIGAGMAGLTAAQVLTAAGHEVVVLDKGRSPGGRMATRRLGGARIDHGAQFFTVRSAAFAEQVAQWVTDGVVQVWSHGFGPASTPSSSGSDGYPRYIGTEGMTSIPKAMAAGLDLRCNQMVFTLRRITTSSEPSADSEGGWEVVIDDASTLVADNLIVTSPLPQTASLLMESGISVPEDLWRIDYHRTIGVLIALGGPSALSAPGALTGTDLHSPDLNFVADQSLKGISAEPALLVHASHEWSLQWWDEDPTATVDALLELAAPYVGSAVIGETQLKKWRLAAPKRLWPEAFWVDDTASLYLAGDAFSAGSPEQATVPNLEGAYLSGRAVAEHLLTREQPLV
jgi:renalase